MLQLFHSIFQKDTAGAGRYPEALIEGAMARALDATDPRLRAVSGYKRRLRPAVIAAIDYVVNMIDGMVAPVELTHHSYATDPRLMALFTSVEHMREMLMQDQALADFRRQHPRSTGRVYALLIMEKHEKQVFGMELRGDVMQREVAQTSVNFTSHTLFDLADDETEARRLLKRRAFDHLLSLALARISEAHEQRETLKQQRALLQGKIALLKSGQWGFQAGMSAERPDPAVIEARLADIEAQLHALRPDTATLSTNLDILIEVLNSPGTQLWGLRVPVVVDRMGIARERAGPADLAFQIGELHSASGYTLYLLPVCVLLSELPPPLDPYVEARRYLG